MSAESGYDPSKGGLPAPSPSAFGDSPPPSAFGPLDPSGMMSANGSNTLSGLPPLSSFGGESPSQQSVFEQAVSAGKDRRTKWVVIGFSAILILGAVYAAIEFLPTLMMSEEDIIQNAKESVKAPPPPPGAASESASPRVAVTSVMGVAPPPPASGAPLSVESSMSAPPPPAPDANSGTGMGLPVKPNPAMAAAAKSNESPIPAAPASEGGSGLAGVAPPPPPQSSGPVGQMAPPPSAPPPPQLASAPTSAPETPPGVSAGVVVTGKSSAGAPSSSGGNAMLSEPSSGKVWLILESMESWKPYSGGYPESSLKEYLSHRKLWVRLQALEFGVKSKAISADEARRVAGTIRGDFEHSQIRRFLERARHKDPPLYTEVRRLLAL